MQKLSYLSMAIKGSRDSVHDIIISAVWPIGRSHSC